MSLESSLEKLAPVAAPNPVRPVAKRSEPSPAPKNAFAQMLRRHGQPGADGADELGAQAAATRGKPRGTAGAEEESPTEAEAGETEQAGHKAQDKATPAQPGGADEMRPVPSTLQWVRPTAEDGGVDSALFSKASAGHGRAGRHAPVADLSKADADKADAAQTRTEAGRGFGAALSSALGSGGADGAPASAVEGSALKPQVDQALSASDGSLPSLGAVAQAPVQAATDQPGSAEAAQQAQKASAELPVPPQSPAFPSALGVQLSTWLRDGVEHASLELNPRDLGPIEVRIEIRDGAARIDLGAEVASTRAALAEALPQLAEHLGDVGLNLTQGSVFDQSGDRARQSDGSAQTDDQGRGRGASGRNRAGFDAGQPAVLDAGADARRTAANRRGLLDLYA